MSWPDPRRAAHASARPAGMCSGSSGSLRAARISRSPGCDPRIRLSRPRQDIGVREHTRVIDDYDEPGRRLRRRLNNAWTTSTMARGVDADDPLPARAIARPASAGRPGAGRGLLSRRRPRRWTARLHRCADGLPGNVVVEPTVRARRGNARLVQALMSDRWLKACGKTPSCSPALPISSEYRPRWLA